MKIGSVGSCCGCEPEYLRVCFDLGTAGLCYPDAPEFSVTITAGGETTTGTLPNFFATYGLCLTFPMPSGGADAEIEVEVTGGEAYHDTPQTYNYTLASPYGEPGTDIGDGGEFVNAFYEEEVPLAAGFVSCSMGPSSSDRVIPDPIFLNTPTFGSLALSTYGGALVDTTCAFRGCTYKASQSDATHQYDYYVYQCAPLGFTPNGWKLQVVVTRLSDGVIVESPAVYLDSESGCGTTGWAVDWTIVGGLAAGSYEATA